MRSYLQSAAWHARAATVIPGGAHTASKAPGRVGPLGAYPLYLADACGVHVTDVDGQGYLDWYCGNCAVVLGHQPASAIAPLPSLPSTLEVIVAEQLVEIIPCAEQIRVTKTGSEACAAAVRIARMATGRPKIAIIPSGYHGWHSWCQAVKPEHPGIPAHYGAGVVAFERSLHSIMGVLHDDVAAVMIEPTAYRHADPDGFLASVVALCHARGALCIFDEMITGGRWALAGGQEYFAVVPDLACYGKALANGAPFAFVCGREKLMRHAWAVSGTYGGEQIGMASCLAVLAAHRSQDVIGRIWSAGQRLMGGLSQLAKMNCAPVTIIGYPCRPIMEWVCDDANAVVSLWQQTLADGGILCHPSGWNPSAAHSDADVDRTLTVCGEAFAMVMDAIRRGDVRESLRGTPITSAFVVRCV